MQVLSVCELTGYFSVDLRQDALTLRAFAVMDSTWKEAGFDLKREKQKVKWFNSQCLYRITYIQISNVCCVYLNFLCPSSGRVFI